MGKYSIKKSKNGLKIIYKSKKEIQINQEDVGRVNSGCVDNLVHIQSAFSNEVIYEIGYLIPLKQYLKKNMSIDVMFKLISQTIETLRCLNKYSMSNAKLVLNSEYIFFDENNFKFYFMYEPYISDREMLTPNNFWISTIDSVKIKDVSQREQCLQLKQYLMDSAHQDIDLVYGYVTKNNMEQNNNTTANLIAKPVNLSKKSMDFTNFDVANDEQGTTLLVSNKPEEVSVSKNAYLTRKKDGQRVDIVNDLFIVGKSGSCDYTIIGNSAVSRQHIKIIHRSNGFFINDMNSTNRTFINNTLVEYNREYKLSDGDCIKLADEELDFHIR